MPFWRKERSSISWQGAGSASYAFGLLQLTFQPDIQKGNSLSFPACETFHVYVRVAVVIGRLSNLPRRVRGLADHNFNISEISFIAASGINPTRKINKDRLKPELQTGREPVFIYPGKSVNIGRPKAKRAPLRLKLL
jgi:hypothetical protein